MNVPSEPSPSMSLDPAPQPLMPQPEAQRYQGLGGWLILVAIGLIVTPIRLGIALVAVYLPLFAREKWEAFTTPGGVYYHPLMGPMLITEVVGNTLTIVFAVVLLIFFFAKKSFFPMLMIIFLAANAVFVGVDHIMAQQIPLIAKQQNPAAFQELARVVAGCLVWIPYMLVSRRVKATFTR